MRGGLALGTVTAAVAGLVVISFALGATLGLAGPEPWLTHLTGRGGAAVGVAMLIADVLLPVPASAVMVWLGASHGVYVGATLGMLGSVGGAALGFGLGAHARPWVERRISMPARRDAHALLVRWAAVAVVMSRPVPVLAETVVIVAGLTGALRWRPLLLAATVGAMAPAWAYAAAGARGAATGTGAVVIGGAVALGGTAWAGRLLRGRRFGC